MEKENVLAMNGGENSCVPGGSLEDSQDSSKVRGLFAGGWDKVIYYSVQCLSSTDSGDFGVSAHEACPVADHITMQPRTKVQQVRTCRRSFPCFCHCPVGL